MTTEQLLQPRFEVIADYPMSKYKVGSIITWGIGSKDELEQYPHIFKPLQWWEHRKESELPSYIKNSQEVIQIKKWAYINNILWCTIMFGDEINTNQCYVNYIPATPEEYTHINTQNQQP